MSRVRRHVRVPPDLTSLFDVLFIVIFAALIRAVAVQQAAAQPKSLPPPAPLAPTALQARALADLDKQLAARPFVVARVSAAGVLVAVEQRDQVTKLDAPLTEHSPDPDIGLAYLGDRSAEQRVCRLIALHLGVPELAQYLVIIAPEERLADLPHALYEGLRHDVDRCLDQKGLAVLVDPAQTESGPSTSGQGARHDETP